MRHPFECCASRYLCFCLYLGADLTCYVIAVHCIVMNGFMAFTNFGVGHWALYLISIITRLVELIAGVCLFLGTIWERVDLKLTYCWMVFVGIFLAVTGLILYIVLHKHAYTIWSHCSWVMSDIIVVLNTVWLVLWNIYTPMVVLGNLCDDDV